MTEDLIIAGTSIAPGERHFLDIPVARLPTETTISLPVTVARGTRSGPCLWLSAAIHGDELNGVEIIRQVLAGVRVEDLHGTLIAAPIVNIFGFLEQSRYLPDRRDLNRSFPGSAKGSLASRLAHLFMEEIVRHCTHGVDLHTASANRTNLPQIRANLDDPETARCARAFGAPVAIHATVRDGSLRQAAAQKGIPVLLYEGGEALRFDTDAIQTGVAGIFRVMEYLQMHGPLIGSPLEPSTEVRKSRWVRAPRSGLLRLQIPLGARVAKKQLLGTIANAFGETRAHVYSPVEGLAIGHTQNPSVNQGDAIFHIADLAS